MFKPKSLIKNTVKNQVLVLSVISILVISIISQDASAAILSSSDKNAPHAGEYLLSLNNTAKAPLLWVNGNGKLFAASNADFANSTSIFDSGKFCIRNPTSTFTTCIANGANVANRTLNWPVLSGTDTIDTLGLAQTISAVKTFSGGITMSSADISLGSNNIKSTSYKMFQSATGIAFANGFVSQPISGNAIYLSAVAPSGTSNISGYMSFRTNSTSTNYEGIALGTDLVNTNEVDLQSFVGGTGTLRPLKTYMGTTLITQIATDNGFIVGSGSNQTTGATTGFFYVPVTDGTPTGVPPTHAGSIALQYDGKSNKLYVYNGAWKAVTLS